MNPMYTMYAMQVRSAVMPQDIAMDWYICLSGERLKAFPLAQAAKVR
ncbi:MAG: hypothetical protein HUU50_13460 [Candidatus Brocadiae bacterium]|nr:hypothetical protein [Candidatus Brocadiia bacterium]